GIVHRFGRIGSEILVRNAHGFQFSLHFFLKAIPSVIGGNCHSQRPVLHPSAPFFAAHAFTADRSLSVNKISPLDYIRSVGCPTVVANKSNNRRRLASKSSRVRRYTSKSPPNGSGTSRAEK